MRKKEKNQMAKNYSQYSIDNEVNIIPEEDFKSLIRDTFKVITQHVGGTAGPYGSQVMLSSSDGQSTTTKDGFNSFSALSFMNPYKKMVYLAIKKICERVNNSVGDGTTSCILLGENLFNQLNDVIQTPDEKRRLLETISEIESELMNDIEGKPLSDETLFNLVNMTANYDKKLTEKIIEAFAPEYDMYGVVSKIRNVIPEQMRNMDSDETQISLLKIPGDYHVRVFMEPTDASEFEYAREVRIVVYDHAMTEEEWNKLEKPEGNDQLIILARDFTKGMLEHGLGKYIHCRAIYSMSNNVFPCWVKGRNVQDEIKDLCTVIGCDRNSLIAQKEIKYTDCTKVKIEIFNKNCMCFYVDKTEETMNRINTYIDNLKEEMLSDTSNSIIKNSDYKERIEALQMENQDTIITCSGTSAMEVSMIMDKIVDCIAIVKSAFQYGTVPNLIHYGFTKVLDIAEAHRGEEMYIIICNAIMKSIEKLFEFIYVSKYGTYEKMTEKIDDKMETMCKQFYTSEDKYSFDIVSEEMIDYTKYPTSAQYDIEVLAAAISIVKYLLTSRSFIFDAAYLGYNQ